MKGSVAKQGVSGVIKRDKDPKLELKKDKKPIKHWVLKRGCLIY